MRLTFNTEQEAQAAADAVHLWLIDRDAAYAASVAAGHTLRWAVPALEGDLWVVPLGMRCKYFDPTRAPAEESAWTAIKAERDRRQHAGVHVGAKWYHSDADSRIQQLGLVIMGAGIPPGLQWKTLDGSFITMTQQLAGQVFQATAVSDMTIFAVAEQHKAAMLQAANPLAYDFSAGWPASFEG